MSLLPIAREEISALCDRLNKNDETLTFIILFSRSMDIECCRQIAKSIVNNTQVKSVNIGELFEIEYDNFF